MGTMSFWGFMDLSWGYTVETQQVVGKHPLETSHTKDSMWETSQEPEENNDGLPVSEHLHEQLRFKLCVTRPKCECQQQLDFHLFRRDMICSLSHDQCHSCNCLRSAKILVLVDFMSNGQGTSTAHFLRPEEPPNGAEVVYSFLLQAEEGTNSTMLQAKVHIVHHLKQPRRCHWATGAQWMHKGEPWIEMKCPRVGFKSSTPNMVGNLGNIIICSCGWWKNDVHQLWSATPSRSQRDPPWCRHIEGVPIPSVIQAWLCYTHLLQYIRLDQGSGRDWWIPGYQTHFLPVPVLQDASGMHGW